MWFTIRHFNKKGFSIQRQPDLSWFWKNKEIIEQISYEIDTAAAAWHHMSMLIRIRERMLDVIQSWWIIDTKMIENEVQEEMDIESGKDTELRTAIPTQQMNVEARNSDLEARGNQKELEEVGKWIDIYRRNKVEIQELGSIQGGIDHGKINNLIRAQGLFREKITTLLQNISDDIVASDTLRALDLIDQIWNSWKGGYTESPTVSKEEDSIYLNLGNEVWNIITLTINGFDIFEIEPIGWYHTTNKAFQTWTIPARITFKRPWEEMTTSSIVRIFPEISKSKLSLEIDPIHINNDPNNQNNPFQKFSSKDQFIIGGYKRKIIGGKEDIPPEEHDSLSEPPIETNTWWNFFLKKNIGKTGVSNSPKTPEAKEKSSTTWERQWIISSVKTVARKAWGGVRKFLWI